MRGSASRAATISLVGGRPVLDLVNTVSWRGDPARLEEHLQNAEDAVTWVRRAGVLSTVEAARLRELLGRGSATGTELLDGLLQLRALVADAVVGQRQPVMSVVEPVLLEALVHSHLLPAAPHGAGEQNGAGHQWHVAEVDVHTPRRRLALDLLDLLITPPGRLGTCADAVCGWVFLDTSRGQNRQWCSSSTCGNRHRVRRHQQRRRRSPRRSAPPNP